MEELNLSFYREILKRLHLPLAIIDSEFNILFASSLFESLFIADNRKSGEILFTDIVSQEDIYILNDLIKKADLSGKSAQSKITVTASNKLNESNYIIEIVGLNINNRKYYSVILEDINRHGELFEQKSEFARGLNMIDKKIQIDAITTSIAHEFNNCLAIITGNLDLIETDDKSMEFINNIHSTVERMELSIKKLLTFSGEIHYSKEKIEINSLLQSIKSDLLKLSDRDIKLNITPSAEDINIFADREYLIKSITELFVNAADAIEDEGIVSIETGKKEFEASKINHPSMDYYLNTDRYAYIKIKDSGRGMDKFLTDRVFEPYRTGNFKGRGLGLSAVMGFMTGHGGSILIESETGKGTRITLVFPPYDSNGNTDKGIRSNKMKSICVLCRERKTAEIIRKMIERMNFAVIQVDESSQLRKLMKSENIVKTLITDYKPGQLKSSIPDDVKTVFIVDSKEGFEDRPDNSLIILKPVTFRNLKKSMDS